MKHRSKLLSYVSQNNSNSNVEPSLDRAIFLAKEMGNPLELFSHCGPLPFAWLSFDGQNGIADKSDDMRHALLWMEQVAKPLLDDGLNVCTDVIWSRHQYDAVMQKVSTTRPGFMIQSVGGDDVVQRRSLNGTDWHLIRDCPCPLLLAQGESRWETRRIVACVDPAHSHSQAETLDNVIIETARMLAYRLRSTLHIFHSIEALPVAALLDNESDEHTRSVIQNHRLLLDRLLKRYGFPDSRIHMVIGDPVKTLPPFLEQCNASLVVMGAVAKGPLEWLLVGNTAEKVLNHIGCDILIVKSQLIEAKISEQIQMAFA